MTSARAWRALRTGANETDNPTVQAILCQFPSGSYSQSIVETPDERPKAALFSAIVQTLHWLSATVEPLMSAPTPDEAAAQQPADTPSTVEAQDSAGHHMVFYHDRPRR